MSIAQKSIGQFKIARVQSSIAWRGFATTRIKHDADRRSLSDANLSSESTLSESSAPLPSTTSSRRTALSNRLSDLTDNLLARASIASAHINAYTGTDYTAISHLRAQIASQETAVRNQHAAVEEARQKHQVAHSQQSSAQKEIVGLLERKSSWTPADLERYMSLVRSEHTNEQAVQAAKDDLVVAERTLEDARQLLERLERKQYHEEQIWSDTIRRNSTWVTFGLMGVNILLLLVQIAVLEPWRRKKIVREVGRVVEEKTMIEKGNVGIGELERQVDEVVQPAGVVLESVEDEPPAPKDALKDQAAQVVHSVSPTKTAPGLPSHPTSVIMPPARPKTWAALWESYVESFQDLFSERIIELKKVDVTTTALQGAATGFAAMGILFVVFRPR